MNTSFLISARRLIGFGCLCLWAAAPASAATWDIRVSGLGARSCADWVEWKDAQKGELRAMTIEWALGFISGHNVYARMAGNPANSVVADVKVLSTLLDAYCQKAPESKILAGVIEITKSLGGANINLTPKAAAPGGVTPPGKPAESKEKGPI
ncbi:MAG: hypothetical protein LWW81_03530 [Rhodocyclales bacterium]|nr:hypothetical protein [Rhodocyclales bacterium]